MKGLLATIMLLGLGAAGCAADPPEIELVRGIDFGVYRTFALIPPASASGDRTVRHLERGLRDELVDRGLQETGPTAADLRISFDIQAHGKTRITNWDPDTGWRTDPLLRDVPLTMGLQGLLVVEAYDPALDLRVWRATASTDAFAGRTTEDSTRRMANEVLATLPVGLEPAERP